VPPLAGPSQLPLAKERESTHHSEEEHFWGWFLTHFLVEGSKEDASAISGMTILKKGHTFTTVAWLDFGLRYTTFGGLVEAP
jgi:hypothetical protein